MPQIVTQNQAELEREGWEFQSEEIPPATIIIVGGDAPEVIGDLDAVAEGYRRLLRGDVSGNPQIFLRVSPQAAAIYTPYRVGITNTNRLLIHSSVYDRRDYNYRIVVNVNTKQVESWEEEPQ